MIDFIPITEPNIDENEKNYVNHALDTNWISSKGEYINRFEEEFAKFCGVKYAVSVANGTVALHLALISLGIGPGDEVIIPDLTFAATINTVLHAQAIPVIVDIEPTNWCIDPAKIKEAITNKTKAIIPVHLYGQPCNMDEIKIIANEYKLNIIEDCAEAHGAEYKNKKVGSIGDIGSFSFFGNKILTTGEGGICTTNSKKAYTKMKQIRDHGMSSKKRYWHDVVGYNYRMTNLQAAIGCAQIEKVETILQIRESYEVLYKKLLKKFDGIIFQNNHVDSSRVIWLVSILIEEKLKDSFQVFLEQNNIDYRPFFYPLSQMPLYKKYAKECSVSVAISKLGLNLPTYSNIEIIEKLTERFKKL